MDSIQYIGPSDYKSHSLRVTITTNNRQRTKSPQQPSTRQGRAGLLESYREPLRAIRCLN